MIDYNRVIHRVQSSERMLRSAREEITRSHAEDAAEFLRAAARNIEHAIRALDSSAGVIPLRDSAKSGK